MTGVATGTWLDWRDPAVGGLAVLLVANLVLLSSAVRDGALADVSVGLAVCYATAAAMIGVSRDITDRDGYKFAFAGGVALFVGVAFVVSGTTKHAVFTGAFGLCSVYYYWRFLRTSA